VLPFVWQHRYPEPKGFPHIGSWSSALVKTSAKVVIGDNQRIDRHRRVQISLGIELIYFGQAALVRDADLILKAEGLGRAHYRVLYVLARQPNIMVGELTQILRITPQAVARVLNDLLRGGYVVQQDDPNDRRRRLNQLTRRGQDIEAVVFAQQSGVLNQAFEEAGPAAAEGFLAVLRALLPPEERKLPSDESDPATNGKIA
jgi:DNA-binding MarR family transcriptional regulator